MLLSSIHNDHAIQLCPLQNCNLKCRAAIMTLPRGPGDKGLHIGVFPNGYTKSKSMKLSRHPATICGGLCAGPKSSTLDTHSSYRFKERFM